MKFTDALNILSKSSSYAVSTENDLNPELAKIKESFYVQMTIEQDFFKILEEITESSRKVVFLCGSSGDGKSELLLRAKQKFEQSYLHFHLDATHSFAPHDSAIDTLNDLFSKFENGYHSLIIGINIGMLGNYAEEAKSEEIKNILNNYLNKGEETSNFKFINFENYPKFKITRENYEAEFISKLFEKITSSSSLLYQYYIKQLEEKIFDEADRLKIINYKLLCNKEVQKVIIELLLKTRLFRNQFITARAFLDLVHELICGKGYLFDNLFNCNDNEILLNIKEFDPALQRTKNMDRFIIAFKLKTFSDDFLRFNKSLFELYNIGDMDNAMSYIRLFYIFKFYSISNNFHNKFKEDFEENLLNQYLEIYRHHKFYDVSSKPVLKNFYSKDLIFALRNYINKKSPYLDDDQYLIANYGDNKIISYLKITPNFQEIEEKTLQQSYAKFQACLKIKDHKNINIFIDINLFNLLYKLKSGYRPNRNDKSVVVVLNTIVNQLLDLAKKSKYLRVNTEVQDFRLSFEDEDEIEVVGIK